MASNTPVPKYPNNAAPERGSTKRIVKPIVKTFTNKKIAEGLQAVLDKRGNVTKPLVVEEATNPSHLLHNNFTWDNDKAAHEHRLEQAGRLIQIVRIERLNIKGETRVVRKYHSLPSSRDSGGGYEDIDDILADDAKRQELLQDALAQLKMFIAKYETLVELAMVINPAQKIVKVYLTEGEK